MDRLVYWPGLKGVDGFKVAAVAIQGCSSITVRGKAWMCIPQAVVRAEQAICAGATNCGEMQFVGKATILHSPC